jgi:hypothetical protein
VVFSEYERMTWLAGEELGKLGIGFVSLHGGVPSRKRGELIEKFRRDPLCRVFLSTDAGGVGLNLQAASAVVNFEPPWNPARLEQRIGRVHRLGQSRPVQVIHLLTTGSIEERVWETLRLKRSLFAGVFDSAASEVSFAALGRKTVLQQVKEIFASQPESPKPVAEPAASAVATKAAGPAAAAPRSAVAPDIAGGPPTGAGVRLGGLGGAAAGLIEAGVRFLESLAAETVGAASGVTPAHPIQHAVAGLFSQDPRTNRPVLSIPLPESITQDRLTKALAGLLGALGRGA